MVRELLSHGADINAQDNSGLTALMEAVDADSSETVKLLLEHGADAALKNNQDMTALAIAIKQGNNELQALLPKQ